MRSLFIFSALLAVQLVAAQSNKTVDPDNSFIRPPLPGPAASIDDSVFQANEVYTLNEKQNLPWAWKSTVDNSLRLLQEGNPSDVKQWLLIDCPSDLRRYYWNGTLPGFDLSVSNIFFLAIYNCSAPNSPPLFYSHYFNVTQPAGSTASTSAPTSTASNTSPIGGGPSNGSNNNGNSGSYSNSVNGAAIGGGVGGGVGGAILLVGLGVLILLWKRCKKRDHEKPGPSLQQEHLLPYQHGPRELPGDSNAQYTK